MNLLLVIVGGFLGAIARVASDSAITHHVRVRWPLGTLTVNVTGSLILGAITGLALAHGAPEHLRLALGVGFCGAFTTFSTASFEVVRLAEEGRGVASTAYALGGLAACLAAAAIGLGATGGF